MKIFGSSARSEQNGLGDSPEPQEIVNETSGFNNNVGSAQAIDRNALQVAFNPNLFDDDLPSVTIRGAISTGSPSADVDFYLISLNQGEKLILDIDNTSGDLDTVVRIYDGKGNLLGYVDDSRIDTGSPADHNDGTGYDSFLTFRAPTSGTFYFSVESWGEDVDNGPGSGTTTGSYDLNVSIGPVASAAQILDEDIEALIDSQGWPDPDPSRPGTNLTYSFPNSAADYAPGTHEATNNFEQFNVTQKAATAQMLQQISTFANLTFDPLVDPNEGSATIRYAMSDDPDVAYAYLPGSGSVAGTAWFRNSPIDGRSTPSFDNPVQNGYAWLSIIHETGHTLGLKHGHEFPAVNFDRDSLEYTVMTYRSYPGSPITGYRNENFGFPSTYMALDIAALQRIYGANFNFNSGDTVYSWSPTSGQFLVNGSGGLPPGANRVFMTVWDGGGNDTYDLSNYATNLSIDLRPGNFSITATAQLADLGDGHFSRGNVFNAFLYNDDPRSLIENATGGSGNDLIQGNDGANVLRGGTGNDTLIGFGGNDALTGGDGFDVTSYSGAFFRSFDVSHSGDSPVISGPAAFGADTLTQMERADFQDGLLELDNGSIGAQVYRVYQLGLADTPDQAGWEYFVDKIEDDGIGLGTVAQYILDSAQYQSVHGSLSNSQFVDSLYLAMGRAEPDTDGKAFWVDQLDHGALRGSVLLGFSESAEYVGVTGGDFAATGFFDTDDAYQTIALVYDAAFDRLSDDDGMTFWAESLKSGKFNLGQIADLFIGTDEFQAMTAGMSNDQLVDHFYQAALDRPSDAGDRAFWTDLLDHGASVGVVLLGFALSAEHIQLMQPAIIGGVEIAA